MAMTPAGEVILVKLRYARGWRLPGGGRSARESPAQAVVRELREEIGLTAHGRLTPLSHIDPALVLVEDVIFETKRWSLEVERVTVAPTNALPHDISPLARRWIRAAGPSHPR